MQKVKLLIIEDNKRYVQTIKKYFESKDSYEIVNIFYSVSDFRRYNDTVNCDIVLLDINLPDGNGIELIPLIKSRISDCEIIILTTYTDEDKLFMALREGASGYITKEHSIKFIEDAIADVLSGGAVISPDMAGRFLNYFGSGERSAQPHSKMIDLNSEEIEVIEILARGLTNREISEALRIRYRYVKTILSRVYKKFGTSSRAEVVRRAVEMGIIKV
ncbi:MAG: response regulator transcription factor [Myxococcota bacterium]